MDLIYYIFVIYSCYIFAKNIERKNSIAGLFFLALYMSFLLAIRQTPGDNIQYEDAYKGLINREYESGWTFMINVCKCTGLSLVTYKCIGIHFLQIFPFFLSLKKEWLKHLSLFTLFYCLFGIESSSNIMRHWLAACIILIGYRILTSDLKKMQKWIGYVLCVFVATRFHSSAYIALLSLIMINIRVPSYKYQCIIYLASFVAGSLFMNIWEYATYYLSGDDFYYNFYFNHYEVRKVQTISGLGQFYYVIESCLIAYMYNYYIKKNQISQSSELYYKIYFWGMALFFLTCTFSDMARLALYFSIVQIIIISMFVAKGIRYSGIIKIFSVILLLMRIALFIRTTVADEIYGITPIKFLI